MSRSDDGAACTRLRDVRDTRFFGTLVAFGERDFDGERPSLTVETQLL